MKTTPTIATQKPTKPIRARRGAGAVRKKGRSWQLRFTDGDGVRKEIGAFATKAEADTRLKEYTAEAKTKRVALPDHVGRSSPFIRDLLPEFLAQRKQAGEDRSRAKHFGDLVDKRVGRVNAGDLRALVKQLREPPKSLSGGSVERVLYLASSFYRWHLQTNPSVTNPVTAYLRSLERTQRNVLRSQHDHRDTPFIERREDLARVFRALPEPMNIAYGLSAFAGLRPGEALALEWEDVDLAKGILTVRQALRHGKVGGPKSTAADPSKRNRKVPITPSFLAVLQEWRPKAPGVLVVPARRGDRHLDDSAVQDALDGIWATLELPRMTFYSAGRHSFASQWVLAGQDVFRLSKVLGHSSVETTKRYAHLTDHVPASVLAAVDVPLG
jgi:integrase